MNVQKGFAEEAAAFLEGCRTGKAPIPLMSLIDTTRATLKAVESLVGTDTSTYDDVAP